MAWLARSFANTLNLTVAGDDTAAGDAAASGESAPAESPRGVKEDLTELSNTLSRQFWGVASFLAPSPSESSESDSGGGGEGGHGGIRGDLAEIGGRFRSGISRLSNHQAVAEISKIASSFLGPIESDEEEGEEGKAAVGVTEEVLTFARNVSMHPETWLDFPLFVDDEEDDGLDMSDAQQAHALAVERLSPRLAALRIELCPRHMSEGCFWKIYFVLLHSRLTKHDADLLSTPQVVEARAMLTKELQNRTKTSDSDKFGRVGTSNERDSPEGPDRSYNNLEETRPLPTLSGEQLPSDVEMEKHPLIASEVKCIDKSVIKEEPIIQNNKYGVSTCSVDQKSDEDGDDWFEDNADAAASVHPLGNEEDVSFSDLEDNDDDDGKITPDASKGSGQWKQMSEGPQTFATELSKTPKGTKDKTNAAINIL